jgi:hypothetical protein
LPEGPFVLTVTGLVFFVIYLFVGNICRKYHEKEDDSCNDKRATADTRE